MTLKLPAWLKGMGPENDLILSSRVRLARNLDTMPFPYGMSEEEKDRLIASLQETLASQAFRDEAGVMKLYRMEDLSGLDRQFLLEKHLISPAMLDDFRHRALILSEDERVSILINEEDHFRIQAFSSGLDLAEAYGMANKLDDLMERFYSFAFHPRYGYLTTCPTNVGTGVRFSVMAHLPALEMTGGLRETGRTLSQEGFVLRGFFGEGSEGYGNLYQISNQVTLGVREEDLLQALENRVQILIREEKKARARLFANQPYEMQNIIYRAYGILRYGVLLTAREGMNNVSLLRLGMERGMSFEAQPEYEKLNSLVVLAQPAGLQSWYGKLMSPEERDQVRPGLFREVLGLGGR